MLRHISTVALNNPLFTGSRRHFCLTLLVSPICVYAIDLAPKIKSVHHETSLSNINTVHRMKHTGKTSNKLCIITDGGQAFDPKNAPQRFKRLGCCDTCETISSSLHDLPSMITTHVCDNVRCSPPNLDDNSSSTLP